MANNEPGPAKQIFCQNCRGGNPPDATICMWCGQTIATPAPTMGAAPVTEEPPDIENIRNKAQQILMRDEQIQYIAVESKPVQINIAPDAVILTNRRLIIYRPQAFGRATFEDFIWRELHDAQVTEGMLRATFTVMTTDGRRIEVKDVPKDQARKVYQFAQQMEEYVLEERRMRELEEKRAESGTLYFGSPNVPSMPPMPGMPSVVPNPTAPAAPSAAQNVPPQENPAEKLAQLKQMLDSGLITQEMYDAKREEILRRM